MPEDLTNFATLWKSAKKINAYNATLKTLLTPPLNQIKLVQITNNNAIFIAKNQSILTLAKNNYTQILSILKNDLAIDIQHIEIKIMRNC